MRIPSIIMTIISTLSVIFPKKFIGSCEILPIT